MSQATSKLKEVAGVASLIWMVMVLAFAAGFVLGNTTKPDINLSGIYCADTH